MAVEEILREAVDGIARDEGEKHGGWGCAGHRLEQVQLALDQVVDPIIVCRGHSAKE